MLKTLQHFVMAIPLLFWSNDLLSQEINESLFFRIGSGVQISKDYPAGDWLSAPYHHERSRIVRLEGGYTGRIHERSLLKTISFSYDEIRHFGWHDADLRKIDSEIRETMAGVKLGMGKILMDSDRFRLSFIARTGLMFNTGTWKIRDGRKPEMILNEKDILLSAIPLDVLPALDFKLGSNFMIGLELFGGTYYFFKSVDSLNPNLNGGINAKVSFTV